MHKKLSLLVVLSGVAYCVLAFLREHRIMQLEEHLQIADRNIQLLRDQNQALERALDEDERWS